MMTKEEAILFKDRWRLANERISEEIRNTSVMAKLHQLAMMFTAGNSLGWTEGLRAGEEDVRDRWQRLREKMNGRAETS